MVGVRMVRHIAQWLGLEWFVILHNGWGQNGSSYCTLVGVRMVRHIAQWLGLEWLSILHNGWGQNGSSYCPMVEVRMVSDPRSFYTDPDPT